MTKMKYSVIIAERNEPDLAATVANIKANSSAHVIVMSDTKGLGPQAMRDKGIELAAGSDVCIIMDGHMRVKQGTLDTMAQFCLDNPTTVAGTRCHHSYKEDWTTAPYHGARIAWTAMGSATDRIAFAGKWRKETSTGQIPCVMGACYGFTRDWYYSLTRPWRLGTGWGCDEEILSAATWLRGGSVELLPLNVWHQARNPKHVPYKMTPNQLRGVWANRTRILDMLPMSADERLELVRHMMPTLSAKEWKQVGAINAQNAQKVADYRNFLGSGPLSWADFKRRIVGVETVVADLKSMKMGELRNLAEKNGIKRPFPRSKVDICKLIQQATIPPTLPPTLPPARPRANWGADEINNAGKGCCSHCGSDNAKTITTKRAHRVTTRYRKCNDCNKRFVTRQISATA
jgi:hypothetical protein